MYKEACVVQINPKLQVLHLASAAFSPELAYHACRSKRNNTTFLDLHTPCTEAEHP